MKLTRFIHLIIVIVLQLASLSAFAGIFQCEDDDGRTIFADQPCKSGISKEIEQVEAILEPFVSGRITQNDTSFPLRQGIVLWDKKTLEMKLVLTKLPLSATQSQLAIIGDWSFLEEHKQTGLAEITLIFKSKKRSITNLRTMRTSIYGLNKEALDQAWTTNHGGEDVIGHIHKLDIIEEKKTKWLAFASQEMSPEIRWNINLALPISK